MTTAGARTRGFTLVEVLVALAVLALMAGMAWRGVEAISATRDASQRQIEQVMRVNTALAQWRADLGALQDSELVAPLAVAGSTVRLTRHVDGGLQVVVWWLQTRADGGTWMRWGSTTVTTRAALQDAWLRSQQLVGNEPGQVRVLDGVQTWNVQFNRGGNLSNAQSTGDLENAPGAGAEPPTGAASAPPRAAAAREALPTAVRLMLDFVEGSGLSGSITVDTMVAR